MRARAPSSDGPGAKGAESAKTWREASDAELADRLSWFVRLRWGAAAAIVLASLSGPALGLDRLRPTFLLLGAALASFNFACWRWLCRLPREAPAGRDTKRLAVAQIGVDLTTLLLAAHYTGGLGSPLLPFFGFHMAIGTILVSTETMYVVAALTSLGAAGLCLLETGGFLEERSLEANLRFPEAAPAIGLLAFVVFLFGVAYLTGSVSDRLKQRNLELRRTTSDLGRLLAELAELERRKSHYMRVSAHQLRSPLGTVRTSLDVLAGGYVPLSSERARHLIEGASERIDGLLAIVNGLLDLAKVREGQERAPWTRNVNVNQLLADLFDSLAPLAEERGVRLVPDFDGAAILEWGVPPDLVHAFENLIHNAIRYSKPEGEVVVRLRVASRRVVVRVEDTGIGVPEDFRDRLFLEFMRAPNARAYAPDGTGLGLALVREVALAHGGSVTLDTREGPGAAFRIELPLEHRPEAAPVTSA